MTDTSGKASALRIAAVDARKAREWVARRNRAIRGAHEEGATLREIGEATGLSHEAVRKIINASTPTATA